mmetsp:Transcript_5365/g.9530  ORF Transcript_5365/g.9530 Transcript_5365/m.9530 type:complete len:533 (-) Transcript_5365:1408-3006(-)|eukprot:CAMPEP_0203760610 /NCGR_PEP_ID=MMETSP0098-20131031/13870_1 /ASSEMBLY_ACC=CAM_ASM_000208 /TAXON_ID=96639 /ORGANISM=" , Strain NY0313808BC1" /LENGTH=532 /DNA_ID=CAMNT_0050654255 /DNA_START=593 /DNA_END=2191 /DNA_ORIENTATION=+
MTHGKSVLGYEGIPGRLKLVIAFFEAWLHESMVESGFSLEFCRLLLVSCFASLGGLLFGYDIGVVGGVKVYHSFLEEFGIDPTKAVGTADLEMFVSVFLLGCAVGGVTACIVADGYGRKWSVFLGASLFNVATLGVCLSQVFWLLIATRFFVGVAVGSLSFVVPMYLSEISPKHIRGSLVTLQQVGVVSGICLANLANILLEHSGRNNWRLSIGAVFVFSFVLNALALCVPESPRWLLKNRGYPAALASFELIREKQQAKDELEEIRDACRNQDAQTMSYREIFVKLCSCGTDSISLRIWIACALQMFQQLTGMNVVMYYAPEIFLNVGMRKPLVTTAIIGLVNLLGTVASIFIVARVNRRPLLIFGASGMAISMGTVSLLYGLHEHHTNAAPSTTSYLLIVCLMLFVFIFAISWGPGAWLIPSEIFPLHVRAKAVSLATASNWIGNFFIGQLALSALHYLAWGAFLVLVVFHISMGMFVYRHVLETRGKTLEQIDNEYKKLEKYTNENGTDFEKESFLWDAEEDDAEEFLI